MTLDNGTFWMVWNPNGRAPVCRHRTEEDANTEATRLARQVEGQVFIVLKAEHAYRVVRAQPPVERVSLGELSDEIPS